MRSRATGIYKIIFIKNKSNRLKVNEWWPNSNCGFIAYKRIERKYSNNKKLT